MTVFDRFNLKVVAFAGLCGAAIALSPDVAAAPLKTGGYGCVQGMAGEGAAAWDLHVEALTQKRAGRDV
ncbi:MAG: hypothetical protein K2X56_06245, partial [Mycobacterium pseudokansasii]|nr:hypothetical protein [Mycobacterium pseudokansasii]